MIGSVLALLLLFQGPPAGANQAATGQVRTADGAPVAAIRVSALPAPPPNIRPSDGQNYYATQAPVRIALTDNAGRYRLANLPPGRYFIVAGMLGQETFYPATTNADAATIVVVGPGTTTEGLDVTLATPPGGRVTGRVTPAASGATQEKAVLSGLKLGELLEAPVRADGTFDFGRLPRGEYLVSLFPAPPGMRSLPFRVGDEDVSSLQFVRPSLHTVTGRIVVQNGPLPNALLAFSTVESYEGAPINPDGTFSVKLQPGRHLADLGGMPVGYSVASVRVGNQDASRGLTVGNADVSGVVITVAAPRQLPRLKGQIAGADTAPQPLTVELTGPIIGVVRTTVQKDGSFEAAVPPGLYRLKLPQVASFTPMFVVVNSNGGEAKVVLSGR